MYWLRILSFTLTVAFSGASLAVNEDGLWLPSSYQSHYIKLIHAAKLVEDNAHGCETVIRGELKRDLSTKEHPVFRIVCRNEQKRSFALLVDGKALEVIDPAYPGGTISFAELEQLRLLALKQEQEEAEREARRQERARKRALWEQCDEKIALRTRNMKNKVVLTEGMPVPDTSVEGKLAFTVDFDAKGMQGKHLKYRARCEVDSEEKLKIKIRPRRVVEQESKEPAK